MKLAAPDTASVRGGEGASALALFAGLLGPPVVFLADLTIQYSLAYWACSTGNRWLLDTVTLGALVLVAACAGVAWRLFSTSRAADERGAHADDRTRFLAALGLLSSLLFTVAVLAFAVPRLVMGPCYP